MNKRCRDRRENGSLCVCGSWVLSTYVCMPCSGGHVQDIHDDNILFCMRETNFVATGMVISMGRNFSIQTLIVSKYLLYVGVNCYPFVMEFVRVELRFMLYKTHSHVVERRTLCYVIITILHQF